MKRNRLSLGLCLGLLLSAVAQAQVLQPHPLRPGPNRPTFVLGTTWTEHDVMAFPYCATSSADGKKLYAMSRTGQFALSTDSGASWWSPTPSPFRDEWHCVTSSADGTRLVAGSSTENGWGTGRLYYSTNSGVAWIPAHWDSSFSGVASNRKSWNNVVSSADGMKVAAVMGDVLGLSANGGVTWTRCVPQISDKGNWVGLAMSADGQNICAAIADRHIWISPDFGRTWFGDTIGQTHSWIAIAMSADAKKMVATAVGAQLWTGVFRARGNYTWTRQTTDASWSALASSANGNILCAVGTGGVFVSKDSGAHWGKTKVSVDEISNIGPDAVACSADGSKLIVVVEGLPVYTSP